MDGKFSVVFLNKAKDDIANIYEYISVNFSSPVVANNLMDKFDESISYLENDPFIYPLSVCVVKNFVALYRVDVENKEVLIVRVFHGAQDYENHF